MQTLKDEVREQALKCYVRMEDRAKFRGKHYTYLVKIGGGDPRKMIAQERQR